ncbi:NAD(P)H-binding protein [Cellulosimicrobium cellulans]|uniref:SDR family oxidoreductase n=1 Tax=Cellulosimicrobium cellulans TaxID=1710 RepID=UPI001963B0F7|nr:NAD(P)H-binding protein [Cellulosimicrobium cellulans]MBN0038973.1 NAD(P)H-binding protein [Cellulosimicrobium cellulans]
MTAPLLVTGGTGTLGRRVVARLRDAGLPVRVLSRHAPEPEGAVRDPLVEHVTADLSTGEGVEAAVAGVATIVHCAGSTTGDEEKTRTLVDAVARTGGRPHVVLISVVGADRVPVVSRVDHAMFGYFAAKLGAERVVASSGLPWTTLRATQFHDFVLALTEPLAKLPVVPVFRGVRFQPVAADDVADRLVDLALGSPAGLVDDLGGPGTYRMADLVRDYLRATGRRRLVVQVPVPGAAGAAYRDGANLVQGPAVGPATVSRGTWEQFLADRFPPASDAAPGARRAAARAR